MKWRNKINEGRKEVRKEGRNEGRKEGGRKEGRKEEGRKKQGKAMTTPCSCQASWTLPSRVDHPLAPCTPGLLSLTPHPWWVHFFRLPQHFRVKNTLSSQLLGCSSGKGWLLLFQR
jgi:hypothetical protein